jgi:hypothetical protein
MKWRVNPTLDRVIAERGLATRGFRQALRKLVRGFVSADTERLEDEEDMSVDEIVESEFEEWFGQLAVVPAAYKIARDPDDKGIRGVTVHIYESEGTARIPDHKYAQYGQIADGDGPLCNLHIIDHTGRETVLDNNALAPLAFIESYPDRKARADLLQRAMTGYFSESDIERKHLLPPVEPRTIHTTRKEERAILRAVYELGLFQPGDLK